MTTLRFQYVGGDCSQDSNDQGALSSCDDEGEGPPAIGPAQIDCSSAAGILFSGIVAVGSDLNLAVQGGGDLPSSTTCVLTSLGGDLLQRCIFDPSGSSSMELKDKFCSLELESCTDNEGGNQDCISEVKYTYTFSNVGTNSMDIIAANRTRGDDTKDLLPELDKTFLLPGESDMVMETDSVDVCEVMEFCTVLVAEADPPGPDTPCYDEDKYIFAPNPPCDVDVELTCTLKDDPDVSCEAIEEVTELQCTGCSPTTLCFTYTAESCPANDPAGLKACMDLNGSSPQAMADIVVTDGTNMLVDGTFRIGSEFCVSNGGESLPAELLVMINAPMGGATPVLNQMLTIDSTCTGRGLTLLENYGALQMTQYTNCDGTSDCFVPVVYGFLVKNTGPIGLTVAEFSSTINNEFKNLLVGVDPASLILAPTECYNQTDDTKIIDCCSGASFSAEVSVEGVGDDGSICDDVESLTLDKPIETPPPSSVPSASPSGAPTPATPEPSTSPSNPPSTPPSTPPSLVPTGVPSTSPPFPIPGDTCFVQVEVDCTPPAGVEDCDSIPIPRDECLEKVFSMGFRYNGGDCSQESNVQDPQLYQCFDLFGGPPVTPGEPSYFVVQDIKGLGIIYFEGFVPVGEQFTFSNGGELLGANVNVTIYNTDAVIPANIRQTMIIHTSCSQVTFLKDRYGSIELLSFNNTVQGFVSCFVDLSLGFSVRNVVEGFNVILESLTSITNFDEPNNFIDFTDEVAGVPLGPGASLPVLDTMVTIDLSVRKRYTAFSTVQGASPDGFSCRASDFLNFTAGNAEGASSATVPASAPSVPPV
jgi:hypothetical protein